MSDDKLKFDDNLCKVITDVKYLEKLETVLEYFASFHSDTYYYADFMAVLGKHIGETRERIVGQGN